MPRETLKARRDRECNAATRQNLQAARSMAFAAPCVILRGGQDDLTPIFWSWQRTKNGRCLLREPLESENVSPAILRWALGVVEILFSINAAFSHQDVISSVVWGRPRGQGESRREDHLRE